MGDKGGVSDEQMLGKRLQHARQGAKLTQQQLCHDAGLSYSTLAKIERGAIKSPSIFTIQSIAGALSMSLDDLVGGGPRQPHHGKKTSKSGIRFVYFDLNGCLVRFGGRGFTRLAQDSDQPIDVVETIFWKYDSQVCKGEISLDELNTIWAERLGIMVDWKQYYLQAVDKMPGIDELVQWVSQQYYVGVMSNTMPGFIDALHEQALIPAIDYDATIDSSVVHALKPDPRIYALASEATSVQPGEILLVDDNRSNLIAAEEAGWHTIWFDSYQPEMSIASIRSALEPTA